MNVRALACGVDGQGKALGDVIDHVLPSAFIEMCTAALLLVNVQLGE